MAGIYFHIPFCKTKCPYCDFYSVCETGMLDRVVAAMEAELEREKGFIGNERIESIYFGGGTPSLAKPAQIQSLINRVRQLWSCIPGAEITVEANPDDCTPQWLSDLASTDANRISIGTQSFDEEVLRSLGRRHTASQSVAAVNDARRAGFDNISIDLIFGIPGQTADSLLRTLEIAAGLEPEHISAYHLTVEPATVFGKRQQAGQFIEIPDQESVWQFTQVHEFLTSCGYEHYEISNFALPGGRAVHNSAYWEMKPYLGIGPSAHSYNGSQRRWSYPSVEQYLSTDTEESFYESETLSQIDRYNETVMTALRRTEGLDLGEIEKSFGPERKVRCEQIAQRFIDRGVIIRRGDNISLEPSRFITADAVIEEFFMEN